MIKNQKSPLNQKSLIQKAKSFIHDIFFKEVFSQKRYALGLFRRSLTQSEFNLFDWTTLKSEATSFIDEKGKEKRTDLQFSVQSKNSTERVTLLFLIEHKSYQDPKTLLQLLGYQTGIYEKLANDLKSSKKAKQNLLPPVLPILVYQGKEKEWKGPLEFQDSLKWNPELKQNFGKNVLNFRPKVLNIPTLELKKAGSKDLTSALALYILKHIWQLDKEKLREFFVLSQDISLEDRKFLVNKVADYIQEYDPHFSWNILQDIEEKTIKEKEDRVMPPLQYTLDKVRKEGIQAGMQEGIEKGMQQGQRKLILKLLEGGLNLQSICKYTGLSEEEINKLKNSSN